MNDILFFPEVTTVEDDLGQIEEVETFSRQVFCEEKVFLKVSFSRGTKWYEGKLHPGRVFNGLSKRTKSEV